MKLRSIPPMTSIGSSLKRRASSADSVRFRIKGFGLNIGVNSLDNKFNKQEIFKISSVKKSKIVKYNFGLEKLLVETEKRLEKVKEELKVTYLDNLIDEYTRLSDLIRQLKWQIAVRKER